MAKRARKSQTSNAWMIALTVIAALFLVWWLSARRAETPGLPASQPGARALSAPPDSPRACARRDHRRGKGRPRAHHSKAALRRAVPRRTAAGAREPGAKAPGE